VPTQGSTEGMMSVNYDHGAGYRKQFGKKASETLQPGHGL